MMETTIQVVGEKCTGCEACTQSCPFGAISMKCNEEGFFFPIVNSVLCQSCGICTRKCPLLNWDKLKKEKLPLQTLAGSHKNQDTLMASASGGAFTAIIEALQPDVIYGVAWTRKDEVAIISVEKDNIEKLRKSKYIQARVGDAYIQAVNQLEEGKKIVFSGTPCQIGGLYSFLGERPENLYTVEIICHGIGSPGLFKRYIEKKEEDLKDNISIFDFREKNIKTGGWTFYTTITTKTGKKEITSYDPFTQLFLNRIILRKSCESCCYASKAHLADFIIGDYWGCKKHNPRLFNKYGVSVIMFLTEKAKELKLSIKQSIGGEDVITEHVVAHNSSLIRPQRANSFRKNFFSDLKQEDVETVINKYLPKMSWKRKIFRWYDFFLREVFKN